VWLYSALGQVQLLRWATPHGDVEVLRWERPFGRSIPLQTAHPAIAPVASIWSPDSEIPEVDHRGNLKVQPMNTDGPLPRRANNVYSFQMKPHSKHHFTKFNRNFVIPPAKSVPALQSFQSFAFFQHRRFMPPLQSIQKLLDLPWAVDRPYSGFVFG
jgi:hypothetical protein